MYSHNECTTLLKDLSHCHPESDSSFARMCLNFIFMLALNTCWRQCKGSSIASFVLLLISLHLHLFPGCERSHLCQVSWRGTDEVVFLHSRKHSDNLVVVLALKVYLCLHLLRSSLIISYYVALFKHASEQSQSVVPVCNFIFQHGSGM